MSKFVTTKQEKALCELGYKHINTPTVDEAIDWLRRKYNIIIYNGVEPFVDPIENKIVYSYKVKFCSIAWGWNCREHIGQSKWSDNPYAMKRQAIWIAIRYIKKKASRKAIVCKLHIK